MQRRAFSQALRSAFTKTQNSQCRLFSSAKGRTTRSSFIKRHPRVAGAVVGSVASAVVFYTVWNRIYEQYQSDPYESVYDKMIKSVKGGPYRDYIQIAETSQLLDGPLYVHKDSEIAFSFLIPNKFVKPGVYAKDNVDHRGLGGNFVMFDPIGNFLSVDWIKLPVFDAHKLQDGRGDVLRDHVELITKKSTQLGSKSVSVERASANKNAGVPDLFFTVEEKDNVLKRTTETAHLSTSELVGRVVFATDDCSHIFVVTTRYPNSLINYDISRKDLQRQGLTDSEIEAKLIPMAPNREDCSDARLFREMCHNSTSNREEIIERLRSELISHVIVNFKNGVPDASRSTSDDTQFVHM